MRTRSVLPLVTALGLIAGALALTPTLKAEASGRRSDTLSIEQVRKGMKGYGLTVFEGTRPERFDVEVVDVLRNFRPRQDLILIKTSHPRLEVAKIVAGMSGSPIYLDGKMAGAYAYGWSFGVEPIAGVTPIHAMLSDLDRPLPKFLHGLPLTMLPARERPAQTSRFDGAGYDLREHASQLASKVSVRSGQGAALTPLATPLLLGGMSGGAAELLSGLLTPLGLEPLAAGGSAPPSSSKEPFVDGGALGVELVSGDMSAMGIGTVTRVEGDKLVAFGHPMMEVGVTSLPTAQARVLWFMASQQRSFKIGESIGTRGALVNDRQASIVVDQSSSAPRIEVRLDVSGEPGAPHTAWKFQVAHDPFLTPAFLAVALGSGLTSAAAERRDLTYSMRSEVRIEGHPPIVIEDYGSAPSGTPDTNQIMQSQLLAGVGTLFSNPWTDIRLLSVDVKVQLKFAREVAILRGIDVLTPVVAPGQPARLRLWLEPFAGPRVSETIEVPLPPSLRGEEVKLEVRPGYSVLKVRAAPESLEELLSNLPDPTYEPRSVVVSFSTGEGGAAHRGVVASSLPPGALDRIGTTSTSLSPLAFKTARYQVYKTPLYMVGNGNVTIQVKKNP